ncbi:type IV secretory system conjugative DNA transfer family protein [Ruegeria atlantica]|uniref:type IV secretory system conjugative DNA transfer family protein n=1 Tax=Ruegeria atlantica TaxID=81569 RepID=UPI001479F6B5
MAVLSLTTLFVIAAIRGPSTKYGDAVFAKPRQLVKEGYATRLKLGSPLDSEIVFAKFGPPDQKNALFYKPDPKVQKPHAAFIAPTGSGKTSGLVIPNVQRFNGSCVVLDIKGEIFKATGGRRRAMGDEVYVFNPENPSRSHSYNPLRRAVLAKDLSERWIEVIQVATQMFETPSLNAQSFLGGVEGMFCAMAMLVIKRDRPYISEVLHLIKTTKQSEYEKLAKEVGYPLAADEFLSIADDEPKIFKSTRSVMNNSGLQLWRNPSVARVTQGNDINFEDLRRKPAAIYFSISGKKVKEYKTLIRLFFLDLVNTIETDEPGEDEPFKVLILLDEFQRLGNLERVVEAYDTMRSFGGRLVLISQSISRLQEIYGHEGVRAMLANAGTQVFAASEDPEVREHVSRSIGDKTVISKSWSRSMSKMDMGSLSIREEGLRLMRPEQVGRLPDDELVLIREGKMPVIAKKIRYFEDPYFLQFTGRKAPEIKGRHVDLSRVQAKDTNLKLAKSDTADLPEGLKDGDKTLAQQFEKARVDAGVRTQEARELMQRTLAGSQQNAT